MTRARIPKNAFELPLQVRSYEVGREGDLRPANILRYFEYLATEDSTHRGFDHTWYERHGSAWVVREMRLMLGVPVGIGEQLRMATWLSSYGRVQAYREYALWRALDSKLIARAQGRWAYVDRTSGQLRRIPEELISRFGQLTAAMPPWRPVASMSSTVVALAASESAEDGHSSALQFVARTYETDSQQHINNAVYMDWIEDGMALAMRISDSATATSPAGDRAFAERPYRLRRVHLEYLRPVLPGALVRLASSAHWATPRALTGRHTIADEPRIGDSAQAPIVQARTLHLPCPDGTPSRP
jgi:acyl-CoA thioesterase FadM